LHCESLDLLMSLVGQKFALPQRNIGIRFTPVRRHYVSEADRPFAAGLLASDFVLRAIQSLARLSRKRGVAEPSTPSPPQLLPVQSTPLAA